MVTEALHDAGLPPGVLNVVNGRGDVVGGESAADPDVARISFTGSTAIGKVILRTATETMKRVSLSLSGKSPTIILDDANFAEAVPMALNAAFMNNGQACIAGTRLFVPEKRLQEVIELVKKAIGKMKVVTRTIRRPPSALWPAAGTWPEYNVISPSALKKVRRLSPEVKGVLKEWIAAIS